MPIDQQSALANLRLYQLISPSLPIGAFTYSQSLEWAVECGWVGDDTSLSRWLDSVMKDSLCTLELPVLLRLYRACSDDEKNNFAYWSQQLYASRETQELRQEEINRARALLMVLNKLPDAARWPRLLAWRQALLKTQAAGFAMASYHWRIEPAQMLNGYAWSWLENAVNVAVKLIPLGQSDGQAVLFELAKKLPALIEQANQLEDDEVGASTTALAIASSLHETQYTRLFRS